MRDVLITGTSRRFGLYLTKACLKSGDRVFAVTRKCSDDLQKLVVPTLEIIEIDEYSEKSARFVAETVAAKTQKVDLLVNNASVFRQDEHTSCKQAQQFEAFFRVHMLFPHSLTNALAKLLCAKHVKSNDNKPGVVVNIVDIYAQNPKSAYLLYSATKAGLANLSIGLAKKYAGDIRIMSIAPGAMAFLPEHSLAQQQAVLQRSIIRKEAGFFPLLQSIEAIYENNYMTGSTLFVDGGKSVCH